MRLPVLALCTLASLSLLATGCGGDDGDSGAPSGDSGSFVGETDAGTFLVGVVVGDEGHVSAYVCNGEQGASEWFHGKLSDGAAELSSARGAKLRVNVADGKVSGEFAPPGEAATASRSSYQLASSAVGGGTRLAQFTKGGSFSVRPSTSSSTGVFRASQTVEGRTVTAGWVQQGQPSEILPGIEIQGEPDLTPVPGKPLDVETLTSDLGTVFGLEVGEVQAVRLVGDSAGEGEVDVDEAEFTSD